jgi:hypothetical protein
MQGIKRKRLGERARYDSYEMLVARDVLAFTSVLFDSIAHLA